jgi:hypothetical protein
MIVVADRTREEALSYRITAMPDETAPTAVSINPAPGDAPVEQWIEDATQVVATIHAVVVVFIVALLVVGRLAVMAQSQQGVRSSGTGRERPTDRGASS